MVTLCYLLALILNNLALCSVHLCILYDLQNERDRCRNSINPLIFVIQKHCTLFEVGTRFNII
jgi:hypothetical protein